MFVVMINFKGEEGLYI